MRYTLLFLMLLGLVSCKEQEISLFEGENGLTFWQNSAATPTTRVYSFSTTANSAKTMDSVILQLQVTGKLVDFERKLKIKAVEGTTARVGIDYDFPAEVTLPAGSYRVNYPVYIYNTPQMMVDTMTLVLQPVETPDLKLGATGYIARGSAEGGPYESWFYTTESLIISNIIARPTNWTDTSPYGVFSSQKIRFMMNTIPGTTTTSFTVASATVNLPILRAALAAYEAENGPMLDENDIRITF